MPDITPEELRNVAHGCRSDNYLFLSGTIDSAADTIDRQAARIAELEGELRECAMATGLTTGDEENDAESLVEPVTCLPLETAALVSDRISDRDIRIAELEKQVAELRANHSP